MIGNAKAIIQWLFDQQDAEKLYEIKEKKSKRSLTANAYYWSLLNQLASVMRTSSDEAHFMMLRRYGVYEVISVLNGIDLTGYFKYFDEIGSGTVNGKQFTHYKIFKGSSQMDSKEFAVLLDGLISDCEELGIPTLTREEIAKLKYIEMREK
nr:MAG TPA: NinB protein [Caudoviricetes sp.]